MAAPVRELQTCTDGASLERVAPDWDGLASSLPSPMQQRAWLRAALELPGCCTSTRLPRARRIARLRSPGGSPSAASTSVRRCRVAGLGAFATHDARLARESLQRVPGAELELLLGLPAAMAARQAAELGVAVRVYVPYGRGYLPYAVRRAVTKPIMLWWLARDLALHRR